MARSVRINTKGALALLRSREGEDHLREVAERMADAAGGDARGFAETGENRARGVVVGTDRDALLSSIDAGR